MKKKSFLDNFGIVCFLAILCNALWGSAFPAIKVGYEMFRIPDGSGASQILFAGMRFFLAGVLAVFIGSVLQRKIMVPKRSSWGMILKLCIFQTILQYVFFYLGLAHTSGVKGAIIVSSNTFIAILMASLVFKQEKLTVKKTAACILGFAGVVLVNLNGAGIGMDMKPEGEGFLLISVVSYAAASNLLKVYAQREDPVLLSGYQFMAGGLVMTAGGILLGGKIEHVSPAGVGILFYLALVSSVAFSLWGILLKHYAVSRIAVFSFTNPVFGVLLSALILNEKNQAAPWKIGTALILVCAGIYLINRPEEG